MITPQQILKNLPPPRYTDIVIEENQNVRDIMNLISYAHKRCEKDYDKICMLFWTGDVKSTCQYLWDFCKKYIDYQIETEEEQYIKTPARILADAESGNDCKNYALFIAGNLDALDRKGMKINWWYRFTSYNLFSDIPGHVFVVVDDPSNGKEIWIDPVLEAFNYHKKFISGIDKTIVSAQREKLGSLGAVSAQGAINTTAAALAIIPGAQPIAAALGVVTAITSLISGSKLPLPANMMWLCADYQYWVLGQSNVKSDHNGANAAYYSQAANWFTSLFGVPIFDSTYFAAIRGVNSSSWANLNLSIAQRVANYRAVVKGMITNFSTIVSGNATTVQNIAKQVMATPDINIQLACYISDYLQMPYQNNLVAGSWAIVGNNQQQIIQALIANGTIVPQAPPAAGQTTSSIPSLIPTTNTIEAPAPAASATSLFGLTPTEEIVGLGAIIFLLFSSHKKTL